MLQGIKRELELSGDPGRAKILSSFFKTGKGQYGEGDVFLGITVPEQRKIAKKYTLLTLKQIKELLQSKIHERRLTALLILVEQYKLAQRTKELKQQKAIVDFYLQHTEYVNNWDLVDLTADKILGQYLLDKKKERDILLKLSNSSILWERRIAIVATFAFIRNHEYTFTLRIAERLLDDTHDLIHKAVGWMLREVGKRDLIVEEKFLEKHAHTMPRTMLRYAIERFNKKKRNEYMNMGTKRKLQ